MSLSWRGAAVEPGDGPPSTSEWQPVELPGRVDAFAGADAVAYRTEFDDPRSGDESHVVLELDGVFAHARVWCNGEQVAEHDAYFDPLRAPLPVAGENEVVIECRRPADRFGGVHDTDRVPESARVPGVWWDASLETYPDPYVESLRAVPRVDGDDATLEAVAVVVTDAPLDDRLTLSLRPAGDVRGGGMMNRVRVETDPGRTTVTGTFEVRDPSLWWPHDMGSQSRYALRAKLGESERTTVTGLRSVAYGEDGLVINGRRVPARGVNLVDADPVDVERAVAANANLVRAHAHVLSPAVYEACDEHGVLVWQDLPLTGPGEFDPERGVDLAQRLERVRARHPSLAAVSVHDEPIESYADGLGSGVLDRLRFRWRAWRAGYEAGPAERVADAVAEVPTFPVVGPPGIAPDAATVYPGWEFGDVGDLPWVCDRFGLDEVVAEFGAGALAGVSTGGPDFDSDRHATRVDGGVDESQSYQAEVVGRAAETLRRRNANVVAAYALRDVGEAGMGVLGRDGTEKAAFGRLRRAYEPTQAILADPTPGESDLVVVHDRPASASVTVEWDLDGDREQRDVDVEAYGRETVETLSLEAGQEVRLAVAVGDAVVGNEYVI